MITVVLIGLTFTIFTILNFATRKPFNAISLVVILLMAALVSPMLIKMIYMLKLLPYSRTLEFFRASPFLFGPLLYFYAKGQAGFMSKFSSGDLVHFVPYAAAVIIMTASGQPDSPASCPAAKIMFRSLSVLIFTSLILYTMLIFRLIQKHNSGIGEYFSSDTIEINLKWIKWIAGCFFMSYLAVLSAGLLLFSPELDNSALLNLSPELATTFFIFMFSFFALKQPVIYAVRHAGKSSDRIENAMERRYEKSGLKDDMAEKYHSRIIEFMSAEKPYTDPDLTISILSEKLGIPRHHLTQVINEKCGMNFFMFINEYRINEAREMMLKDVAGDYSILRIAYDVGFNSKSTFNTMFKKTTGMTPSEYRKTSVLKE